MAASILNSSRTIDVSVYVVRAFVQPRDLLAGNKELAQRAVRETPQFGLIGVCSGRSMLLSLWPAACACRSAW